MYKSVYSSKSYCQGARCGHLEGQDRAGSFVPGEEQELSQDAAAVNSAYDLDGLWACGYRYGYRLAAEGEELPDSIRDMDPPQKLAQ
jgi:hypothetical protein